MIFSLSELLPSSLFLRSARKNNSRNQRFTRATLSSLQTKESSSQVYVGLRFTHPSHFTRHLFTFFPRLFFSRLLPSQSELSKYHHLVTPANGGQKSRYLSGISAIYLASGSRAAVPGGRGRHLDKNLAVCLQAQGCHTGVEKTVSLPARAAFCWFVCFPGPGLKVPARIDPMPARPPQVARLPGKLLLILLISRD